MWSSESKSRNGRCSRALPTLGGPVQLQAPGKCASGLACSIRLLGDPLFTVWGEKDVFLEFWLRSLFWRMESLTGKYQKSLVYN